MAAGGGSGSSGPGTTTDHNMVSLLILHYFPICSHVASSCIVLNLGFKFFFTWEK
jgi:hypothetical protein